MLAQSAPFGIGLLVALLLGLFMLALVTGFCAASYGRSFWLWVVLGLVLPIISFFLLCGLLARDYSRAGSRLVREAKAILAASEAVEGEE